MARPPKERADPNSFPLRKVGEVQQAPAAPKNQSCNEPIDYERIIDVAFIDASPCDEQPMPDQEGKALNDAKDKFTKIAEGYCATGKCNPGMQCRPVVTIASVTNLGLVTLPTKPRCGLRFKIVGKIECRCVPVTA